jgi:hypothetical protein
MATRQQNEREYPNWTTYQTVADAIGKTAKDAPVVINVLRKKSIKTKIPHYGSTNLNLAHPR